LDKKWGIFYSFLLLSSQLFSRSEDFLANFRETLELLAFLAMQDFVGE